MNKLLYFKLFLTNHWRAKKFDKLHFCKLPKYKNNSAHHRPWGILQMTRCRRHCLHCTRTSLRHLSWRARIWLVPASLSIVIGRGDSLLCIVTRWPEILSFWMSKYSVTLIFIILGQYIIIYPRVARWSLTHSSCITLGTYYQITDLKSLIQSLQPKTSSYSRDDNFAEFWKNLLWIKCYNVFQENFMTRILISLVGWPALNVWPNFCRFYFLIFSNAFTRVVELNLNWGLCNHYLDNTNSNLIN